MKENAYELFARCLIEGESLKIRCKGWHDMSFVYYCKISNIWRNQNKRETSPAVIVEEIHGIWEEYKEQTANEKLIALAKEEGFKITCETYAEGNYVFYDRDLEGWFDETGSRWSHVDIFGVVCGIWSRYEEPKQSQEFYRPYILIRDGLLPYMNTYTCFYSDKKLYTDQKNTNREKVLVWEKITAPICEEFNEENALIIDLGEVKG